MPSSLQVQIWSDVACPWCYVGKRRFDAALASFEDRDRVTVTWRSFELDSSASRQETTGDYVQRLADKYATSRAGAQGMIDRMTTTAAEVGLAMDFQIIQPGNTFDAHRLLHHAAGPGKQGALKEALFDAYFCRGKAMSDHATLAEIAGTAGLDEDAVMSILATDAYARDVREDETMAEQMGIHGVPFFVIGRYGISGAQQSEALLQALTMAAR